MQKKKKKEVNKVTAYSLIINDETICRLTCKMELFEKKTLLSNNM